MEILQYEFMQRALLAGILVGLICPAVGLFIALRRMSMISDALSHVCLSGVAAGMTLGIHPVLSAALFAAGGGLLLERLRKVYRGYSEISIAILLSAGVAIGAIILDLGKGYSANFMSYLFGSIVAISANDLKIISLLGITILLLINMLKKELFAISFDEEHARVSGIPVDSISICFTIMTAVTIALSIRVVGILLVSSLMVLPVATAMRLANSFRGAMMLSILFGETAILIGILASFYLNLAPGGAIVMTSVILLVGTLTYQQLSRKLAIHKGVVSQ
ncbi:metal ABC transporter permease [Desulfotomaculum defluvii]